MQQHSVGRVTFIVEPRTHKIFCHNKNCRHEQGRKEVRSRTQTCYKYGKKARDFSPLTRRDDLETEARSLST